MDGCAYFFDQRFSPDICNALFMFRCRMYNVKGNFRNKYLSNNIDMTCVIEGCDEIETQDHIMSCRPVLQIYGNLDKKYDNIFSENLDELLEIGKTLLKLIEIRDGLIDSRSDEDGFVVTA